MPSLEIVLGLVLVILFYSLLATIVMELISGFLSMRGKHLENVLRSMLASADRKEELFEAFKNTTLYQQLSGKTYGKKGPPSYLNAATFRNILTKVISKLPVGATFREKLEAIPDHDLKELLMQFWQEADGKFDKFAVRVEGWYEEVMDRASGWYKNNTQKILLVMGLAIAVIFNVDTLSVYRNLSNSSRVDMDQILALAETTGRGNIYLLPAGADSTGLTLDQQASSKVDRETFQFIRENIDSLKDPLGIGWDKLDLKQSPSFWFFKVFGWLVTAICISKGAPFWFDLLKKAVNFRDAGTVPASRAITEGTLPVAPLDYEEMKKEIPAERPAVINSPVG